MNKLLRFLLTFCIFYAVDPDEGGGETTEIAADSGAEEQVSTGDEAWDAIQSEDGGGDVQADPAGQNPTEAANENKPAEPTDEQKAAAEAAKKEITDDDLKPLEGAKPNTQERFQKITEGYKAEKQRADAAEADVARYKGSFDSLRELGFTDENAANDLVEFAGYRNILASGNEAQFAEVINAQIKQFQAMHGKTVRIGGSIIDDHADLREKLENLEIDEPTALEVARARALHQRASRETQQQQQHQQSAQQEQAVFDGAVNAVVALENNWRKTDPDFNAILPHLQDALPAIQQMHPSTWAKSFETQYATIKKLLAGASTNNNGNRQSSSLRGNGHMTGARQHNSMQDAVLDAMGFAD